MNKNLKRIIAVVLAVGAFSITTPTTHSNLLTTIAYAADNSANTFSSLNLEKTSGSDLQLYESDDYSSDNKVDADAVTEGDTYYAKTSASRVKLEADGPDSQYVRVFKGTSSSTKGKELGDSISLSEGTNKLIVRIYSSAPDDNVEYSDDDNVIATYTIKVKCTASDDEEDNADSYDDIYLDKLSINGESISLSDSMVTYTYSVANDATTASIKAVPPDEDDDTYSVNIDGTDVNSDDNFKHTVDLSDGDNEFTIKLTDDNDEERDYTVKITRADSELDTTGIVINTATSQPNTATNITTSQTGSIANTSQSNTATQLQTQPAANAVKIGWAQANGGWEFFDSTGNLLKNSWYFDRNYGEWYYLGTDGMMSINSWILTGGKYYYVGHDGAMVTNTVIGKYKVGSDGAWIQ